MTPTLTTEAFAALGAPVLVYVREIKAKEVLEGAAAQGVTLDPEQTLYALHAADGARLAVMDDLQTVLAAARAHEMAPVSLH